MHITENLIKNYTDDLTYRRGIEYYKAGRVLEMDVEIEQNKDYRFNIYTIDAWVSTADIDEYNVQITFNDRSGFMNFQCDCHTIYRQYKREGICKHIVAVLLKYALEYEEKEIKSDRSIRIDKLLRELKSNMIKHSSIKRELRLEIKYCYDRYSDISSSVELKVGIERTYVVKSMKDFLRAVDNGDELQFGKGFTYNPYTHKFKEEDKKILELFSEISELDLRINPSEDSSFSSGIRMLNGKKVFLTDKQLRRFFNLLKDKDIDTVIQGEEFNRVKVVEEDIPFEFNLKLEKDKIHLIQLSEMPRPLASNGRYFFYKNNIYMPSSEQLKIYIPFYNTFMGERSYHIAFDKSDGDKIASFIVPSLKKISNKVILDENLQQDLYEEPLKVKIYLDRDRDKAVAKVIFCYGEFEINPLNEIPIKNTKGVLIRDAEMELSILAYIESFGFLKGKEVYLLGEEDKLVDFLKDGMLELQERVEVYYSESFKNIKVYTSSNYRSKVRINEQDLLEFSFNIEGVGNEELKDIFKALKEKKKYYKLKKGGFVYLEEDQLKNIGDIIEYLDVKDSELLKDSIILSKYNAIYIDSRISDISMDYVERNRDFRELTSNIHRIKDMEFSLPTHLETVMRKYQKIGFKWFKTLSAYGFGGILADEMGLGKTLQAIAFLASEQDGRPSLVVAPTSLIYNWKSEIEKFAPELKTLIISGSKKEREELTKEIEVSDVVITSYPLIRRDVEDYRDIEFKYCILDEAQQIKNPSSMNASAVKEIRSKGYFALTGTPIENSLTELWSIFDFLMPGYLLNHSKFSAKYENPIIKQKDKKALEELNRHIKPFILRRLKKDVIKELPPKIEHKLVVEMTEEQKKVYMAYLTTLKAEIDEEMREVGLAKTRMKIFAALTRLRQICCDPSIFIENYQGESGKILALEELLEEAIGEGHRVLLFSQFTSVLKLIEKRFKAKSIEYMYLDGTTRAEERNEMVRLFNEGQGTVFLISLKAGGTGLNLTGADVVVHFDPWWNPAVEDQATDRAHRIGQKKTVEVIKLLAQGTIEEKIYALQEKKKEIIKNVMDGGLNESNILYQMTQEEIEELFKI
jgi:SNF2 family DNA or RNA helicase